MRVTKDGWTTAPVRRANCRWPRATAERNSSPFSESQDLHPTHFQGSSSYALLHCSLLQTSRVHRLSNHVKRIRISSVESRSKATRRRGSPRPHTSAHRLALCWLFGPHLIVTTPPLDCLRWSSSESLLRPRRRASSHSVSRPLWQAAVRQTPRPAPNMRLESGSAVKRNARPPLDATSPAKLDM